MIMESNTAMKLDEILREEFSRGHRKGWNDRGIHERVRAVAAQRVVDTVMPEPGKFAPVRLAIKVLRYRDSLARLMKLDSKLSNTPPLTLWHDLVKRAKSVDIAATYGYSEAATDSEVAKRILRVESAVQFNLRRGRMNEEFPERPTPTNWEWIVNLAAAAVSEWAAKARKVEADRRDYEVRLRQEMEMLVQRTRTSRMWTKTYWQPTHWGTKNPQKP